MAQRAALMMIAVALIISTATISDMAIEVIGILSALIVSNCPGCAYVRTVVMISFYNFHVLLGILSNGDVFLDVIVNHSKGDCKQDQEGQEKTCAAMKHVGEVDLLFRMIWCFLVWIGERICGARDVEGRSNWFGHVLYRRRAVHEVQG